MRKLVGPSPRLGSTTNESIKVVCYPMNLCNLLVTVFQPVSLLLVVRGPRGVLCAIICPRILTLDPCRGPIGDLKNLGRHSRCGAERYNSRWRPRWPPHPYTQYNSTWICPGVMNLVSLPTFLGSRNPLKSFSG